MCILSWWAPVFKLESGGGKTLFYFYDAQALCRGADVAAEVRRPGVVPGLKSALRNMATR